MRILGTRGVPAAHGGFETFAEKLSLYLVAKGWRVTVYCQFPGTGAVVNDQWRSVDRVCIPVNGDGPLSSVVFDARSIAHASRDRDLCLTLGYNTAIFCSLLRLKRVPNIINMDGIEWSRAKWGLVERSWFWMNDWLGCWLGNHLVADHPEIMRHLSSRVSDEKITTIPYGAEWIDDISEEPVVSFGLVPGQYLTLIARPEPENSILEIVTGFSARHRGYTLVVLGRYSDLDPYHRIVKAAAGPEVLFLGAIYDKFVVSSLRFHCAAYVHGHQVGGTNPSLVEAIAAGNPVLAHDNCYNRWVAGGAALYFQDSVSFGALVDKLMGSVACQNELREVGRKRHAEEFVWESVLERYEQLLLCFMPEK